MHRYARYLSIAAAITGLAIPAAWLGIQRTDAFGVASTYVSNNEAVRARLGNIQEFDLPLLGYSIHVAGARGDANFNLKLKGSQASSSAYVELVREGTWRPVLSRLVVEDGSAIDLLP